MGRSSAAILPDELRARAHTLNGHAIELRDAGYSPSAYSPEAFAMLKAVSCAKAKRTVAILWNAVGQIVTLFEP
jgi:hypothetical protein